MMTNELTNKTDISSEKIKTQLQQFENGFPSIQLINSATIGEGIRKYNKEEEREHINYFKQAIANGTEILKFVPASGAATRMFKHLFELKSQLEQAEFEDAKFDYKADSKTRNFVRHLKHFAFYKDLTTIAPEITKVVTETITNKEALNILNTLLTEEGLNYGHLPKGLLAFHKYNDCVRTPLEEHLYEAVKYAQNDKKECHLHFTVSPEHLQLFKQLAAKSVKYFETKYGVSFQITFSTQKKSTDTIAVNPDNTPFINEDGNYLFRPGGHGALIENLNDLEAEVIFIKNIDNVTLGTKAQDTIFYKQVIAGVLLKEKDTIFSWIDKIQNQQISQDQLTELEEYVKNNLSVLMSSSYLTFSFEEKCQALLQILNRPIRVCGMVKNEGEPGGGPFWAMNNKNICSLQIVESSQIDHNNSEQQSYVNKSTHFNPVDLVCYTKDFNGKSFDLKQFIDPNTGFISEKSKNGKPLKALELPGLWNGAMANWNTIFVEVPLTSFSPVKEVNDLLRVEHQL